MKRIIGAALAVVLLGACAQTKDEFEAKQADTTVAADTTPETTVAETDAPTTEATTSETDPPETDAPTTEAETTDAPTTTPEPECTVGASEVRNQQPDGSGERWKCVRTDGGVTWEQGEAIPATVPTEPPPPPLTPSQQNAIRKAESYLEFQAFSLAGLVAQLEYEQFSTEDALIAVASLPVDWNAQAAEKAASYLEFQAFSCGGLIDQLEYEEFTPEQAQYGAGTTGICG